MNEEVGTKQLRKMTCEMSLLSRPDGSSYLCSGHTSMLTSVYGPAEVKMTKEQINQATVDVMFRPKSGMSTCKEKFEDDIICNTCQSIILTCLHPRSSVSVTVQEFNNDGSMLACAINSVNLALLDASINMKYMVAAVNCGFTKEGELVLDPTHKEELGLPVTMTFAFDSITKDILTIHTTGSYKQEQFFMAQKACKAASTEIFDFYKEVMQKHLSKE